MGALPGIDEQRVKLNDTQINVIITVIYACILVFTALLVLACLNIYKILIRQ